MEIVYTERNVQRVSGDKINFFFFSSGRLHKTARRVTEKGKTAWNKQALFLKLLFQDAVKNTSIL
jgi:hypothetical protein